MHRETILVAIGFVLAGAAAGVTGQNAIAPGHDRVPPYREPSPYISAADIQTALNALDRSWWRRRPAVPFPSQPARRLESSGAA